MAQVLVDGKHETLAGTGNGPVAALIDGLASALDLDLIVRDYSQHALTAGTEASAAAYVEVVDPQGGTTWGVGMDSSTLDASLGAVISAANRLRVPGAGGVDSLLMSQQQTEPQAPPRGHVRVVYLGPGRPPLAGRLGLRRPCRHRGVPPARHGPTAAPAPHDPQFRRNRERVVRDAERENLLLDWDLGIPDDDNGS